MTTTMTQLRREQIGEALGDLEAVFLEPGCFGDCSVEDAAVSLASEFVGRFRFAEVVRRLDELVEAERAGNMKLAGRHLKAVRRKLLERWGIVPMVSVPLIPDAEAKWLAACAQHAAKVQLATRPGRPVPPQPPEDGESVLEVPDGESGTDELVVSSQVPGTIS